MIQNYLPHLDIRCKRSLKIGLKFICSKLFKAPDVFSFKDLLYLNIYVY